MPTIFAKTGGNFSALTWQKVVAGALAPNMGNAQYDALNTERTIAFTPSEAGDCEGVFVCLASGTTSGQTVTVKLQEYVGSTWTDRASKTLVDTAIIGTHTQTGSQLWTYFQFTAAYAITAVASTWRLAISSTSSSWRIRKDTSGWSYAVVLTATTTYSASDNILFNGGITVTLDQSVTATTMVAGVNLHLAWAASPAASYTLTATGFYISKDFNFAVGSEGSPIPYAQKAVINVTNWYYVANYENGQNYEWSWYGQKPTSYYTKLAASANNGQPVFTTVDDMSAAWVAGNSVVIYGMRGYETKTILSVVGTTVTLTTNLASKHWSGWFVVNWTRAIQCGIELQKPVRMGSAVVQKLSGIYVSGAGSNADEGYSSFVDTTRRTPLLLEDIAATAGAYFNFSTMTAYYGTYMSGSVLQNIFSLGYSYGAFITLALVSGAPATLTNIASGSDTAAGMSLTLYNSTLTDIQLSGAYRSATYSNGSFNLTACTVTRLRVFSGQRVIMAAAATVFSDCRFDDLAELGVLLNGVAGSTFSVCNFGQDVANVIDFTDGAYLNQFWLYACSAFTLANGYLLNSITGSWLRVYDAVGTHKAYTTAGTYEKQAVVVRNGSSAILVSPMSASVPLTIMTTVPAQAGLAISLTGYFRKNAAYGSATLPFLRLSGLGIVTSTATMTDVNDTWQALTVTGTPTLSGFATVEMVFQSAGVGAAAYVDDTDMAPVYLATGTQDFWYKGDVAPVLFSTALPAQGAWYDDPYVVATEAAAAAYLGITINYPGKTITLTVNHTLTEAYEYCKAYVRANVYPYFFTTGDGVTFTFAAGWTLIIDGVILSGAGKKVVVSGTAVSFLNGGTTTAIYTDSAGTHVPITVAGIVAGSRLQIYDLTAAAELYNGVVAGTSYSLPFTHTGADHSIRIRLMMVSGATTAYKWYTATGTVTANGLSLNAAQEANTVYTTNGVDGSTVTECSISGGTIRIYVDDPDNTTTAQRLYNWFQYYLSTESGIRDQDNYIVATDSTHYTFASGLKIVNQDTSNPLNITGANIVPATGPATDVFDLNNGASLALNFERVEGFAYSSGSGLSTTEHNQLMALPSAAAVADAVYDEPTAGHVTANTFGPLLASLLLWLRTLVTGRYHFNKLTKVETLKDTNGTTIVTRTLTETGTEISKQ